ncbi:Uncharacterized protein HZ326_2751 [Fusarium oxysporum f. sp. albedinis]|nr:Uncharacterized protein HZ326_2751 [Fusarium oxysporum f. sp. albedinis]
MRCLRVMLAVHEDSTRDLISVSKFQRRGAAFRQMREYRVSYGLSDIGYQRGQDLSVESISSSRRGRCSQVALGLKPYFKLEFMF